jgi:hypothetical protein
VKHKQQQNNDSTLIPSTAVGKETNKQHQHNKQHFFSTEFFQLIIGELQYNLRSALTELEETNTGTRLIAARIAYYRKLKQLNCQTATDEFERNRQHLTRTQRLLTLARQYRLSYKTAKE